MLPEYTSMRIRVDTVERLRALLVQLKRWARANRNIAPLVLLERNPGLDSVVRHLLMQHDAKSLRARAAKFNRKHKRRLALFVPDD